MSVRIVGIQKDRGNHMNPHEAVQAYCWKNEMTAKSGKSVRSDMVKWIEDGNSAYVSDSWGNKVDCYVRMSSNGNKFLQTYANGVYTDNLLSLPEC